jgi:DNA-binding MarR family transcriptional regulator
VELSERLKLDTSTLSRTVDGLVRAGFVTRTTDPVNRRYLLLGLTRTGQEKVEFIDRESDWFYFEMLGQISGSQRNALLESVGLLAEIFRKIYDSGRCASVTAPGDERNGKKHEGQK